MGKVSKVPSGFYTGKEAARRLGIPLPTFYHQVKKEKIPKVLPPGAGPRSEGYYDKKVIDKMAQDKELFILLHSIEPISFERATTQDDVRGIVDLCIAIYGQGGTPSLETRLAIWYKNPEVYYVVKQEGIVVGYVSLIWFDHEAVKVLMGPTLKKSHITPAGSGVYSITGPEHVLPFIPGQPIESLFISLAVRPGMSNTEQRDYAFKLLRSIPEVLESFARKGMAVHKLYATSEKGDGIKLARKLGMKETRYPNDLLLRFELDLEHPDPDIPLVVEYQRKAKAALIEWQHHKER
jgi:hypothetical protein